MLDYNELFGTKKKDDKKKTTTFSDTFGLGGNKENTGVNTGGDMGKDNKSSDSVFSYNPPKETAPNVPNTPNVNVWDIRKYIPDFDYSNQDQDISVAMHELMAKGAPVELVEGLGNWRDKKILSDPSLMKYYQDGTDLTVENYKKVKNLYENKRQRDIDALMQRLNGRKDFEYDPEKDELYQSLKRQALKKGQKAMEDTLSRATQNAGGNNSYAISAAQGAYNDYLSGVDDLIPQLEQLAYGKYQDKVNEDYNMLNLQMALENQDYNRWSEEQARDLQEQQIQKEDYWSAVQWAYALSQDDNAFNMQLASYGITPSGNKEQDIKTLAEMVALENMASKKVSTVQGGESPVVYNPESYEGDDVENKGEETESGTDISGLGLGNISDEVLLALVEAGTVTLYEDGTVEWADGYNKENYLSGIASTMGLFAAAGLQAEIIRGMDSK